MTEQGKVMNFKIYGNEGSKTLISNMIRRSREPHSIIIHGDKGLGKKNSGSASLRGGRRRALRQVQELPAHSRGHAPGRCDRKVRRKGQLYGG